MSPDAIVGVGITMECVGTTESMTKERQKRQKSMNMKILHHRRAYCVLGAVAESNGLCTGNPFILVK
jgi:hypothetical protein